jgi:tetratricopeptide (TPR) repeat protein
VQRRRRRHRAALACANGRGGSLSRLHIAWATHNVYQSGAKVSFYAETQPKNGCPFSGLANARLRRNIKSVEHSAEYTNMERRSTSNLTAEGLRALAVDISTLERTFFLQPNIDMDLLASKLEIARNIPNPQLLGRVLCLKSRAHALLSEYPIALACAQEAIAIFAPLNIEDRAVCAGAFAEAKRVHARVHVHADRISEALPLFAESVQIARVGVERFSSEKDGADFAFAASALFRSLLGFGVCLINIDDFDTAIDTFYEALSIPAISLELWPNYASDLTLARSSLVDALHERASRFREAEQTPYAPKILPPRACYSTSRRSAFRRASPPQAPPCGANITCSWATRMKPKQCSNDNSRAHPDNCPSTLPRATKRSRDSLRRSLPKEIFGNHSR